MLCAAYETSFFLSRQFLAEQLSLNDVLEYLTKEDLAELGLRSVDFHYCTLALYSSEVVSFLGLQPNYYCLQNKVAGEGRSGGGMEGTGEEREGAGEGWKGRERERTGEECKGKGVGKAW